MINLHLHDKYFDPAVMYVYNLCVVRDFFLCLLEGLKCQNFHVQSKYPMKLAARQMSFTILFTAHSIHMHRMLRNNAFK